MSHPRNLCATVEAKGPKYETLRCTVSRPMKHPPFFVFVKGDPDYMNQAYMNTDYHEWSDHRGGLGGGHCIHCGKTLKQVRVLVNPKRPSRMAREIARTPADVPPITFVGKL